MLPLHGSGGGWDVLEGGRECTAGIWGPPPRYATVALFVTLQPSVQEDLGYQSTQHLHNAGTPSKAQLMERPILCIQSAPEVATSQKPLCCQMSPWLGIGQKAGANTRLQCQAGEAYRGIRDGPAGAAWVSRAVSWSRRSPRPWQRSATFDSLRDRRSSRATTSPCTAASCLCAEHTAPTHASFHTPPSSSMVSLRN